MIQAQTAPQNNPFSRSRTLFDGLCRQLERPEAFVMTHADLERLFASDGRAVLRQLMQDHLDLRGAHEHAAPHLCVVGDDGIERPHHRDASRDLGALVGEVTVPRIGYSQRGATSRFPMDAALNLPRDKFSLGVRYVVSLGVASKSFEETVTDVEKTTGVHVAKRQAEGLAHAAVEDFNAFYAQCPPPDTEQSSELLLLSVDGKGIVVRREDLREATRRAAEKRKSKLKTRLTRGEKRFAKRMATVTAVYTVAPHVRTAEDVVADLTHQTPPEKRRRPRPEGKRVWATIEKDLAEAIRDMFDEAERRDPRHEKRWVAVVDGNKDQLALIRQEAERRGVSITIVLDFIHVLQYLWSASTVFHGETAPEREEWVLDRVLNILRGKAVDVAAGMRRRATLHELDEKTRAPVDTCADYLLKYQACLHYDEYLRAGLPIASGVIEGGCRHLINDRMDLSGAHWSLLGAEAVLKLRALKVNGDFDEYWRFHEEKEFERNHAARFRGAIPMPHRPVGRPNLRLVP